MKWHDYSETGRSYGAWKKICCMLLQTGRSYGAQENYGYRFLQTGCTYGAKYRGVDRISMNISMFSMKTICIPHPSSVRSALFVQ
jgi:hypothetical protein